MGERELNRYVTNLSKYAARVQKTETKEQTRAALVRTGILDKQGRVKKRYREVVR